MRPKILMIDNDSDDRFLTKEMFQMQGFDAEIDFIDSTYFSQYAKDVTVKPHVILLDRNSRPAKFTDVIEDIRSTREFELVPVVVISDTKRQEDVRLAYASGASGFIKKPDDYKGTIFKIKTFIDYWFNVVELPGS
jgi:two-component system, response regulator